jgi:hypothetical protein
MFDEAPVDGGFELGAGLVIHGHGRLRKGCVWQKT